MELITAVERVPLRAQGNLIAIGNWDGVHEGHRTILRSLVAEAHEQGAQSVAMGFHPHPMTLLRPADPLRAINTLEERAALMAELGLDVHLVLPFSLEFAAMPPEEFVRNVLLDGLHARLVAVGFNFTFGKGGKGTAQTLTEICAERGVPVRVVPPVRVGGETVSSTAIRYFIAQGDMPQAATLLGRPFFVTGEVVHGDQRGRTIGYPTANVALAPGRQLPSTGVYVVRVTLPDGTVHGGMANLGRRPTFHGMDLRFEVHLFDYRGNLYGQQVKVDLLQRIRPEQAFTGIEALIDQLRQDEQMSREYLAGR